MSLARLIAVTASTAVFGCTPKPPTHTPSTTSSPSTASPRDRCARGEVAACDELAEHWGGREIAPNTEVDRGKADAVALKRACDEASVASACMTFALMAKYGTAGQRDPGASKVYFAKLKGLSDLNGFRGEPPSKESEKAFGETTQACASGRARACAQLGWAAYQGVAREKSVKDAYVGYARACELGSGGACRWAGHFAATYPEVGATAKADGLLRKGCDDLASPGACDELGAQREKAGDAAAALSLFERACDGGSRSACGHAGRLLVARGDTARATIRLKAACEAEEETACKALKEQGGK